MDDGPPPGTSGLRFGTLAGRATLIWSTGTADVAERSRGWWGPDDRSLFTDWDRFLGWAREEPPAEDGPAEMARLGPPVPTPRQVFAIGLNYADHATEAGFDTTGLPQVFTKFASCLTGPVSTVAVTSPRLDWEVELVVVIGRRAEEASEDRGWEYVAGLMTGQDLSARDIQLAGPAAQWSLGKSLPGFGPTGPCLVHPSDLTNPDDLPIECRLNGEVMQQARTSQLVWSVPELIARLSSVCVLLPGDLIFTGTPSGVGNRRNPPRYLCPGDRLVSTIAGIGDLVTDFARPGDRERQPGRP
jgi:2-keto-4-pentenoate hydratase/2-oxohepta-3-ene-1,7-dioic acid hydratase in catechol pathway